MTDDDLVKMYESTTWAERAINDFLCDLEEQGRRPCPYLLYACCFRTKIRWLVENCQPPYTIEELEDFYIECQQSWGKTMENEENLGREGETQEFMLEWFKGRGLCSDKNGVVLNALRKLTAYELDFLAGQITAYGMDEWDKGWQARKEHPYS